MSSAPPVLAIEGYGLRSGGGWLFRGLDLFLGRTDRLALVGRNGAGKTTLLKAIAGMLDADEGRRTIQPGLNVVLLEQDPSVEGFSTLGDFAAAGGAPAHEIAKVADGIGIDLSRDAATASGGERRRAAIARAIAAAPDVLLLDEPTNHLDLHGIEWLESWLGRFRGAFIAISHDRAFLSRLTQSSLWLERGELRRAEVGFGGFEAWTEKVLAEEARAAERLDTKLKAELEWLHKGVTARRKRNQGRLAKLGELRAQRAAMLGPAGRAKLGLAAEEEARSKTVIDAAGVTKRFPQPLASSEVEKREARGERVSTSLEASGLGEGGRTIIRDFTLRIQRGDRIGIVGANGSGKTTLLKLLTGEMQPDAGTITQAKTLTGIVVDQQRKLLEPNKRVRDILAEGGDWVEVRGVKKHVQGYLKEFLFAPELVDARVGTLSGGERSRLLLAREFAREANLLVLDEPTNDLDLETLDLLQEVIADYEGTVLLVSHDRDFLDRTVTVTLGLNGSGRVDVIAGGYADWERKRARPDAENQNRSSRAKSRDAGPGVSTSLDTSGPGPRAVRAKLSYKDQRDLDLLPARVEALTTQIARDEAALAEPDLYARDPARFARLTAEIVRAREEREAAELRWLEVAEAAEALAS